MRVCALYLSTNAGEALILEKLIAQTVCTVQVHIAQKLILFAVLLYFATAEQIFALNIK